MKRNLYTEIIEELKINGKEKEDVRWAGNRYFRIPLETFWSIADTDYDSGYGAPEVAEDLIIVGDGFWLERYEYDGSERFEYREYPAVEPEKELKVDCLTVGQYNERNDNTKCGWETLNSLNGINKE